MKKNIAILTTFRSADEAYSLNRVVINQLKMFSYGDYNVIVVAAKGFIDSLKNKPTEELTEGQRWYLKDFVTIKEVTDVPVYNDNRIDETFTDDVKTLMVEFKEILEDVDVALTHDIVYQPAGLKHHAAIRTLACKGEIKTVFLHWIHSATAPAVMREMRGGGKEFTDSFKKPFPNSFYIAFNEFSIPRIAGWFGVEESFVKYVPHPHDFGEYKHELTQKIINETNILDKEIICMYPCRLDRGKQPHMVLETIGQAKLMGKSVMLIIADFHSTAGDKVDYRNQMKERAADLGLNIPDDLLFLSEFAVPEGQEFRYEMPHRVIQELFELTNVFILPSRSETYSLVAQEAAAKKNFLILNLDFPPFRSIYGDAPLFRKYSSDMSVEGLDGNTTTEYANADEYHRATAQYIGYVINHTRVLKIHNKIRRERNLKTVFKNHIEPLLYADPKSFNF